MTIDESRITIKPTSVWYLRMDTRPSVVEESASSLSVRLLSKPIDVDTYLQLYKGVGFDFQWLDRLVMEKSELATKINASNVDVFVLNVEGRDAGFVELVREQDYVEILYFGLIPEFIGKGLGKKFLNWSIQKAWSYNPKWIQLNTCDLDYEYALPNYKKLGFVLYKTTVEDRRVIQ